jgi:hypothetical protein
VLLDELGDGDGLVRLVAEAAAGQHGEAGALALALGDDAESWIRPWAQSASQPEKLILNLRGIC